MTVANAENQCHARRDHKVRVCQLDGPFAENFRDRTYKTVLLAWNANGIIDVFQRACVTVVLLVFNQMESTEK